MEISINGARILAVFENVPLLGTVRLTQTVTMSWVVMIIISALCIWLGSGLKVTGVSRKQAVAEQIVELFFILGVFEILKKYLLSLCQRKYRKVERWKKAGRERPESRGQ